MSLFLLKIVLVLISGGAGVSLIFAANLAFEQEWFNAVVALIGATAFSIVGRMIGSDISELRAASKPRKTLEELAGKLNTTPPTVSSVASALTGLAELHNNVIAQSPTADKPTFKQPEIAFAQALETGRLSPAAGADNYAGNFMYMGTWDGKDSFKNIETRQYLPNKVNE